MNRSISEEEYAAFADDWIAAWNARDLEKILAHYDEGIEFTSPFVARLQGDARGTLTGKDALRSYFQTALERFPDLHFELLHLLPGVTSVVLFYHSVQNLLAAETMIFGTNGKIVRVLAHYSA
jgi:ketosteroid isomerase-like protein